MYKFSTLARTVPLLLLAAAAGVSVAPLQAQSHEVATAIEIDGRVSVVRGGSQLALFPHGSSGCSAGSLCTVKPKEEIFTGPDGHAKFRISDGSTFEVFPNSRVTFQAGWSFEDMLNLILGKIRVQIEHKTGPNPKKVTSPTALISVRGTIFDVEADDIDGTTLVSVEEGIVDVRHLLKAGPTKTLIENQSLRIYPNQPLAKAGGNGQAVAFFWDRFKGAVVDLVLNNPGGIGLPGAGGNRLPGGQADGGKNKPPTTSGTPPPAPPPAPPGGGGN